MPNEQQTAPAENKDQATPATPAAKPAPVAKPDPLDRPRHYRGTMLYRVVCWMFRQIGRFWLRQELIGLENVPKEGGALILPTHTSYADPPMVGANIPREAHYLSKDGILKVPMLGTISMNYLNAHPIRRGASDREAIKICRHVLKKGYPLLFFPEGTRSRTGKLGPIQGGFAMILDGLDVPYIPVMCQSTYRILPRGAFFPRPRKLTVIYGKPRHMPKRNEGEATRDYYKRCCDELERIWREMGAQ